SHATLVTTRWNGGAREPSWGGQASRFGRNATPSGVVIVSGTSTLTQATAPALSRPAEPTARESSRMDATVSSSHSWYWWMVYPVENTPSTAPLSERTTACRSGTGAYRTACPVSSMPSAAPRSSTGKPTSTGLEVASQANSRRATSATGTGPG